MFDDDKTYLERCARSLRSYGLSVTELDTHAFAAVHKEAKEHIVGFVRKRQRIPFYQAVFVMMPPTTEKYVELIRSNQFIKYVFDHHDVITRFIATDISGHDNFEKSFVEILKGHFK